MDTSTPAVEINMDCLVGPTHNFAGLSLGNIASANNRFRTSSPKKAALQGLRKMKMLHDWGLPQAVLPPHERPAMGFLRTIGFSGSDQEVLQKAHKHFPEAFYSSFSSSAMWAANAATVCPSVDSIDGKVHLTPANLATMVHRTLETPFTKKILKKVFADPNHFVVHEPVYCHDLFSDEGAANHNRLCPSHGQRGLQVFVYGKKNTIFNSNTHVFPARQSLEASKAIVRKHNIPENHVFFFEQEPEAIDAGAFHNDVVSVSNESVFLVHEQAFSKPQTNLDELQKAYEVQFKNFPRFIHVPKEILSLKEAVRSYLFNSQLITMPHGSMKLLAPTECIQNKEAQEAIHFILSSDNPIHEVEYFDLTESMANGGGPACLRLRVVLNKQELEALYQPVLMNEDLYEELKKIIEQYYLDELQQNHLLDSSFLNQCRKALEQIVGALKLGSIYSFQK